MISDLDSLSRSYSRLSRDVGGRIEFAFDVDSTDALSLAEQEQAHLDQAFFVLGFSALEKKITRRAAPALDYEGLRFRQSQFCDQGPQFADGFAPRPQPFFTDRKHDGDAMLILCHDARGGRSGARGERPALRCEIDVACR
jgi:hypothetical protein